MSRYGSPTLECIYETDAGVVMVIHGFLVGWVRGFVAGGLVVGRGVVSRPQNGLQANLLQGFLSVVTGVVVCMEGKVNDPVEAMVGGIVKSNTFGVTTILVFALYRVVGVVTGDWMTSRASIVFGTTADVETVIPDVILRSSTVVSTTSGSGIGTGKVIFSVRVTIGISFGSFAHRGKGGSGGGAINVGAHSNPLPVKKEEKMLENNSKHLCKKKYTVSRCLKCQA